jgi:hypothetical protein
MRRKRGIMCVAKKMVKLWIESTKKLTTRLLKGMSREYYGQVFFLRRLGMLGLTPTGENKYFYHVALVREEVRVLWHLKTLVLPNVLAIENIEGVDRVQMWYTNVGSKKDLPLCMIPC